MPDGPAGDTIEQRLDAEWKQTIGIQTHFNEIIIRNRTIAFTVASALVAAGAGLRSVNTLLMPLVAAAALVFLYISYLLDRGYYYPMLLGAVDHAREIDRLRQLTVKPRYRTAFQLSDMIRNRVDRIAEGSSPGYWHSAFLIGICYHVPMLAILALLTIWATRNDVVRWPWQALGADFVLILIATLVARLFIPSPADEEKKCCFGRLCEALWKQMIPAWQSYPSFVLLLFLGVLLPVWLFHSQWGASACRSCSVTARLSVPSTERLYPTSKTTIIGILTNDSEESRTAVAKVRAVTQRDRLTVFEVECSPIRLDPHESQYFSVTARVDPSLVRSSKRIGVTAANPRRADWLIYAWVDRGRVSYPLPGTSTSGQETPTAGENKQ